MIFKVATLAAIKSGAVTAAFRRGRRPRVTVGGALRTAVGLVAITAVVPIARPLTATDAAEAGFRSRVGSATRSLGGEGIDLVG